MEVISNRIVSARTERMAIVRSYSRITAGGMLREGTPVEDYLEEYGLLVKREDKACPPPGPPFSKTRGVYSHVAVRPETLIGVLDTYHSQAGHAVARACQVLGKQCLSFYPEFKHEPGWREPQERARELGAELYGLKAGRSAILFHTARKETAQRGGYMMPNALKLKESVEETALEVNRSSAMYSTREQSFRPDVILVPASSGTIAAGVILGFARLKWHPVYLVHLGYSRSHDEVKRYLFESSSGVEADVRLIDEGYGYKDQAREGPTPSWPCNAYYDLKAFRWWLREGRAQYGQALLWNVG